MGAWEYGTIKAPTRGRDDPRLGALLIAFKTELVYNGYDDFNMEPIYGGQVAAEVSRFQRAEGITETGAINPKTSRYLFRKRVDEIEAKHSLPSGTLGKKVNLESLYDPVAIGGQDPADRGITQINLKEFGGFHDVTLEQAYEPAFALEWSGKYIRDLYNQILDETSVMKAARAGYNIGWTFARMWMYAGFPASGGPDLGGQDAFTRATEYLQLVDKQPW